MRYAFFILFFLQSLMSPLLAREIKSFDDSEALTSVSAFLEEASDDSFTPTLINDKIRLISALEEASCVWVSADAIYDDVEVAFKKIARFYPDEDIPFQEALLDLEDYLDHRTFKKCTTVSVSSSVKIISNYYVDLKNEVHFSILSKIL